MSKRSQQLWAHYSRAAIGQIVAIQDRMIKSCNPRCRRPKWLTEVDGRMYIIAITSKSLANMKGDVGGVGTVENMSNAFDTV